MKFPPRHVGIVGNRDKLGARVLLPALVRWIRKRGLRASVEREFARAARGVGPGVPLRRLVAQVDTLVVLGGDGTFLATARAAAAAQVPILGVNLGGLGFLTETAEADLYPALERVIAGSVEIEHRLMLEAEIRPVGRRAWKGVALNEAVIHQAEESRVVRLEVRIGRTAIGTLSADGLIVATPTGSTAYSLSAGGPIVRPTVEALLATPICPHALAFRPLLIGADETIRVRVHPDTARARLTLDGQVARPLSKGSEVVLRQAATRLPMISLTRESFYEVLRRKLAWAATPLGARARN